MSISIVENRDCLEAMKEFPDKFFDLAIVDPPYGISIHKMSYCKSGAIMVGGAKRRDYSHTTDWDSSIPNEKYFEELFRVSKAQIVWGGELLYKTLTTFQIIYLLGQKNRRKVFKRFCRL